MEEQTAAFEGWCILELMGHRRIGGYVKEVQVAGAGFLRIDVWADDDKPAEAVITQFYPPSSVYCLTPTTEAMARAVAKANMPQPVQRWELPQLPAKPEAPGTFVSADDDVDLTDDERNEIF